MKANKKDVLKHVLKLAADKPTVDFTGSVMEIIEADAAREAALKSLLQQPTTDGPAFNFTASVMAQITSKNQSVVFKPIITKKAWYVIGAVVMLFLLLIGLSNSSAHTITDQSRLNSLLKQIDHLPSIYLMAIITVGVLLFIDYLFTQRTSKTKTV